MHSSTRAVIDLLVKHRQTQDISLSRVATACNQPLWVLRQIEQGAVDPTMSVLLAYGEAIGLPLFWGTHHHYLSTSCLHSQQPEFEGLHAYCQGNTGLCGAKTPGVCKFCNSPCICPCHGEDIVVD